MDLRHRRKNRRDSWTPNKPDLSLVSWMDMSRETFADNEVVVSTTDWAGNSRVFTQADAAKRMKFKLGAAPNGLPGLRGDGVDDLMVCTLTGSPRTLIFAGKFNGLAGGYQVYQTGSITLYNGTVTVYNGAGQVTPSPVVPFTVLALRDANDNYEGELFGDDGLSRGVYWSYPHGSTVTLGSTFMPASYDYFETLIYSGALSNANISMAIAYLKAKWAL